MGSILPPPHASQGTGQQWEELSSWAAGLLDGHPGVCRNRGAGFRPAATEFPTQTPVRWKWCWAHTEGVKVFPVAMSSLFPPVAVSYTMLYNSLDFPVGVVPVTLATDEDEKELKNYQGYFQDWWDRPLATVSCPRPPGGLQVSLSHLCHIPYPLPFLFAIGF